MRDTGIYAQKKHILFDIPFLGPLVLYLYAYFVNVIFQGVTYFYLPDPEIRFYVLCTIFSLLLLLIHRVWFRHEYRGGLYKGALGDKKFWILFIAIVVIDSGFYIGEMIVSGFAGITAEGLFVSVMAGVSEEIVDRYLVISTMMRRYKKTGNYLPVLIFSSVAFGLSHYINMTSAADFWNVTLQVLVTICSGFAMGAVFIRTGNILLSIGWHFLHDFLSTMVVEVPVVNPTIMGVSKGSLIECAVAAACYVVFGILVLRGQKENIMNVWNNRWPEESSLKAE